MIHKLYSAYNFPADHDVCHLFEHLVIRRFLRAVEKSGKLDEMIGLSKELGRMNPITRRIAAAIRANNLPAYQHERYPAIQEARVF